MLTEGVVLHLSHWTGDHILEQYKKNLDAMTSTSLKAFGQWMQYEHSDSKDRFLKVVHLEQWGARALMGLTLVVESV